MLDIFNTERFSILTSKMEKIRPRIPAAEKNGELKNWRIWYKTGQLEVLMVHDLLPHPATAGEITQQG